MRSRLTLACCAAALARAGLALAAASEPADTLQQVVVTASLEPQDLQDVPASVAVLDAATLRAAGEQHFEDVIGLVPNLNWAGDTSRPRYFQIRGIGELDQYQGAPNPSVGFLIDDIDFSGLGSAATLFDMDHIEVLRGPQSTRYGANALAGLIYAQSAAPENEFGGRVEVGGADYGTLSYGAVLTGPVPELDSAFRLAVQRFTSDGFYSNAYLHRDDTDDNDELTLRGRWRIQPSAALRIDLTVLDVQVNNGYDAWDFDNTRTTQSDQPGEDIQHSTGAALRLDYGEPGATHLTFIGTAADTRVKYGFDSDFGNPVLWAPYTYEYTDTQTRTRWTKSLELRLSNPAERALQWLIGLYAFDLTEDLNDTAPGLYLDPFDPTQDSQSLTVTTSHYHSRNLAAFGELDGKLAARWRWSLGARVERRMAFYRDVTSNLGEPDEPHEFAPVDHLWGGDATLNYDLNADQHLYMQVARGYKAGGFNLGPGLPSDQILFSPESDLNVELGYKADLADKRLRLDADVFYTRRWSLQLQTGEQLVPDNPSTFVLYTSNVPSGRNYGLESTLEWLPYEALELGASLGLLNSAYHGLTLNGVVLPDRALPNAPGWQAAVSVTLRARFGAFLRVDVTGSDGFYFDVPALDPYKSNPYALFNAKAGLERGSWSVNAWIHNIANKDYAVRGFYFGDVPPNFPNQTFTQLGPPRQFGAGVAYSFH
jgi:iron complex outermembrane receptor protein